MGVEVEGGERGRVEEFVKDEGGGWSVSVGVDGMDLTGCEFLVGWETDGKREKFRLGVESRGVKGGRATGGRSISTKSGFDAFEIRVEIDGSKVREEVEGGGDVQLLVVERGGRDVDPERTNDDGEIWSSFEGSLEQGDLRIPPVFRARAKYDVLVEEGSGVFLFEKGKIDSAERRKRRRSRGRVELTFHAFDTKASFASILVNAPVSSSVSL